MVQVGCGSVGLIRTGSSAIAIGPIARHRAAATPKSTVFMIASLSFFSVRHGCMDIGALPRFSGPSQTALPRGKAQAVEFPLFRVPIRPDGVFGTLAGPAIAVNASSFCGAEPAFPSGAGG